MDDSKSETKIMVLEDFHEETKELWVESIPRKVGEGQRALLVVGIHEGVALGPIVRNVNTAGMILERIGTLDDGLPLAVVRPQDVAEFVLGALRGAELEGEKGTGKTNTAVFWLVTLKPNGMPSGSPVRRWTYRAIGRPDARISCDGHAVPTREEREAFKEHARRYR